MHKVNPIIEHLKKKMAKKECIVAVGVDDFKQENCCYEAGCDLLLIYPTVKYQNAKNRFLAGYLAFGNTNEMMFTVARDDLPLMNNQNLLAGINGSDPFKNDAILLKNIKNYHFAGIHNYPAMALIDGNFGMNMENLKLGFEQELQFFKKAKESGLFTCAMVRSKKQAMRMVRTGVDVLIFYIGLGEKNNAKDNQERLWKNIVRLKELTSAVRNISREIPLLFFSESIHSVDEIKKVIREVPKINGYLLLLIAKQQVSKRRMQLEIAQLKKIQTGIQDWE